MAAIRFYTDECVAIAVADGLRRRGVDVVTARDAELLSATDENHLELAESEGRVIFTQDDDFLQLHAAGRPHYGIVYASKTTSIGDIVNGLMLVYNVLDDEECAITLSISESAGSMPRKRIITATINGRPAEFLCQPRQTLLEVLRDVLDLTGTKEGCSNGNCGACTVLLDGRAVDSCLVLAVECESATVDTIEGVAPAEGLDPIQHAFLEQAALQCGICTPGFIMAAKALLDENPRPGESEIRFHLAGNLCRCTGYDKIIRAVQQAAVARTEEPRMAEQSHG